MLIFYLLGLHAHREGFGGKRPDHLCCDLKTYRRVVDQAKISNKKSSKLLRKPE
jgi:hypothetical protein